jgi:hypothetical protein
VFFQPPATRRHPGTPHIPRLSPGRHRRIWLFEHEQESGEAISQTSLYRNRASDKRTDLRLELRSKMLAEVLALPDLAQNPKLYRAFSPHSAIFTSLAGKIVRSLPVLKNHRMKRAPRPGPCARSFNCFANFDLCSSLTATSEPSSENSSPLAIAESDSTCCAGELAIEARVFDFSPAASFNC